LQRGIKGDLKLSKKAFVPKYAEQLRKKIFVPFSPLVFSSHFRYFFDVTASIIDILKILLPVLYFLLVGTYGRAFFPTSSGRKQSKHRFSPSSSHST
jgi:hypothetical protein